MILKNIIPLIWLVSYVRFVLVHQVRMVKRICNVSTILKIMAHLKGRLVALTV